MGVAVKQAEDLDEKDLAKVAEDIMEDVDAARRAISDICDDDLGKLTFITGLLFGGAFKQILEGQDVEWSDKHGYGIPYCLPFTDDGEWDGVSFQRFVVGIQLIADSIHVHEDEEEDEEGESEGDGG